MSTENVAASAVPRSLRRRLFPAKSSPTSLDLLILIGWPWLLVFIKGGWGFTPLDTIDAWVYSGFMLDLPSHERSFPGTYYGTRLPFLLPGYSLYQLLPPLVANYALHVGVYYVAILSLYFILNSLFNRRTALLTSLFLGSYGWFLVATGWDYVDGAGIAYMLLTMLLLLCAARNRWWKLALLGAGASSIALFTTNLFLLSFAPFLAAFFLFANWKYRKHNVLISLAMVVIGALIALALFGFAYNAMTGKFFYFMDSVGIVRQLLSTTNPENQTTAWYWSAAWLVFPVVTAVSCVLFWVRRRIWPSSEDGAWEIFFQIWFIALFLVFWAVERSPYAPVFQLFYYASYLLPATFLVIGSLLTVPLSRLSPRQFVWVGCGALIFLGLSHLSYLSPPEDSEYIGRLWNFFPGTLGIYSILVPVVFLLLGFLLVSWRVKPALTIGVAFLCFGICNNLVIWIYGLPAPTSDAYSSIIDGARVVETIMPQADGLFWYNGSDQLGEVYSAIAATNLWGFRLINEDFPSLANQSGQGQTYFEIGEKLILLSTDKNVVDQASAKLKTIGLDATFMMQRQIVHNGISFYVTFATITDSKSGPPSGIYEF